MESQPQNLEFRIKPENFHPWTSQNSSSFIISYLANNLFFQKMLSAYHVCCLFSNALQNTIAMEANPMNPDQV